jgi:hypothetical protein
MYHAWHARGVRSVVLALALVMLGSAARAEPPERIAKLPELATIEHGTPSAGGEHGRARIVVRGTLAHPRDAVRLVDAVIADVERRFVRPARHADPEVVLCLLPDDASYRAVAATLGDIPSPWGFYRPDRRIAVANVGQSIGNLRHELVHPLLGDDFPAIPAWLNEGIAALYGTARPTLLLFADRRGKLDELYARLRDASGDTGKQRAILEELVDERAFRAWATKLRL